MIESDWLLFWLHHNADQANNKFHKLLSIYTFNEITGNLIFMQAIHPLFTENNPQTQ